MTSIITLLVIVLISVQLCFPWNLQAQTKKSLPSSSASQYIFGDFPGKGSRRDWEKAHGISMIARELRIAGDYNNSIRKENEAIKTYPYDPSMYVGRGLSYYQLGKREEKGSKSRNIFLENSVQDYFRAIQLDKELDLPNDWQIHNALATSLFSLGRIPESIDAARKAINDSYPAPPADKREAIIKAIDQAAESLNRPKN